MERQKMLPIGIENFEEIRTEGFYYVDKTGLIRELLHNWGKVNLFTRPRRFGKSLNMSMLKTFFEIGCDGRLFEGLKIGKDAELCEKYMGQFPVISISLKGVSGRDFDSACAMLCGIIGREALRFYFLKDSEKLSEADKRLYEQLITVGEPGAQMFEMSNDVLAKSLLALSALLHKHYERKVIILIDEYDVPLAKAFDQGYYEEMVNLIRLLFEYSLKSNDSLHFAVLTGCLRVSKESIFTGLNNPKILTITDVRFDEYFGFTDAEVKELLEYYHLTDRYELVKEWYDGYRFGNVDVYCPWDVINYCDLLRADHDAKPQAYWSNTSSNDIVRRFMEQAGSISTKREIEQLLSGEAVIKKIRQDLTYRELYDSIENIWSVLFNTGYLTQRGKADGDIFQLVIPNTEIRRIFAGQAAQWFQEKARQDGAALEAFCEAFRNGDEAAVEQQFKAYLKKTISIRDTYIRKEKKENFYHGILLGLLGYKDAWMVSSNKESGYGYTDILIEIEDEEIGIVIELKYADKPDKLDAACAEALKQIEEKNYEEQLRDAGMNTILKYGIACHMKTCKVVLNK